MKPATAFPASVGSCSRDDVELELDKDFEELEEELEEELDELEEELEEELDELEEELEEDGVVALPSQGSSEAV
jgi:F0F1-type ATP synthase membrane subunit b/b'